MKLLYVTSEAYPFCKTGENDLPPVYLRGPGLAA